MGDSATALMVSPNATHGGIKNFCRGRTSAGQFGSDHHDAAGQLAGGRRHRPGAAGTSLPEMAVGRLAGSNIFNMLGIRGTAAPVHPLARVDIGWDSARVMTTLAALLVPMM
jgi:hypothetical protein